MAAIRLAADKDIPCLIALLSELFAIEAEFQPDEAAEARGLAMILAAPTSGRILMAEDEGRAVAMVNLIYIVSTALGARVALLEDMIVTREARGQGLGRALIEAAIAQARSDGCRRITLLTDGTNTAAHAFYERAGFTRSAMVPYRLALKC